MEGGDERPRQMPRNPAYKRMRPSTTSLSDGELQEAIAQEENQSIKQYLLGEVQRREQAAKQVESQAKEKTNP